MVEPIFLSPFFINFILPFILVFTLIFAVLQKSKLLGDESKKVNAILGLIIGLILIAFPGPRDLIVVLMPFLAVSVVILFVFMLLYGFIVGKKDGDVLGQGWKWAFAAILTIALASFLLMVTGYWEFVWNFMFNTGTGSQILINGLLVIIIAGAIIAVLKGDKN